MLVHRGIKELNNDLHNAVVFKYENDSDLIKLMFLKKYLDNLGFENISVLVTYLPYSRMDRSEGGSPFTLKYITEFIDSLGFDRVVLIEPHSDVSPALLNNVESLYINFDLVKDVMKEVDFNPEEDYIMFPDNGAAKRYSKMKVKNELVGHKHRNFETGRIESLEVIGSPIKNPNKVIIVDDLSSYGGTFMMSGGKLKELGFKEIYLLVGHAENSVFKGHLLTEESPITKVFTTDSILTEQNNWENKKYEDKIKIYSIEDLLINN
ncbi:ribose-phosphate pyrophosphokinase [Priestia aryabhattai]|uniref:ribose-phosphate pyrophosphokinase n=1 Tax=Priestia aryabhattai TaxID=412384 RepID=UPI003531D806